MFYRPVLWIIAAMGVLLLLPLMCSAQLADLDLMEENDRSISASVSAMPNPTTMEYTESRSAVVLLPLSYGDSHLTFQGGAGAYAHQVLVAGELSSFIQWRVQGGPQYKWAGLQFYVEGFWKKSIDYAGFFRFGEFDLGHVLVSTGFGTLVRSDTTTNLAVGVERTAGGGDQVVKGLVLVSGEVDTPLFESLRLLGSFLPGFNGEHDVIGEAQVSYALGNINLVGLARLGYENGATTRQYTALVQVPF